MSTTSTSGWNRSTSTPKPAPKKPSAMRGIIAGLVVVALAAVCVVVFMGKGEKPVEKVEKKPTKIKEVKPAPAPKTPPKAQKVDKPKKDLKDMTPEERLEMRMKHIAEAQKRMKDIPLARPLETNLVFKTSTDQILAMVADLAEGKDMPPLPLDDNFERDFVASLKEPIVINEDDSEKVKELKTKVAQLRKELDERASQGEPMVRILKDFQDNMVKDYKMRDELRLEVKKMIETDGRETAQQYCDKVNESLRQLGIKEIDMPMTREECEAWGEQFLKEREAAAAAAKANGGTSK